MLKFAIEVLTICPSVIICYHGLLFTLI